MLDYVVRCCIQQEFHVIGTHVQPRENDALEKQKKKKKRGNHITGEKLVFSNIDETIGQALCKWCIFRLIPVAHRMHGFIYENIVFGSITFQTYARQNSVCK